MVAGTVREQFGFQFPDPRYFTHRMGHVPVRYALKSIVFTFTSSLIVDVPRLGRTSQARRGVVDGTCRTPAGDAWRVQDARPVAPGLNNIVWQSVMAGLLFEIYQTRQRDASVEARRLNRCVYSTPEDETFADTLMIFVTASHLSTERPIHLRVPPTLVRSVPMSLRATPTLILIVDAHLDCQLYRPCQR